MEAWFTNGSNVSEWCTYREKKSGRIVRACLRTEDNMDMIVRELANTGLYPFDVIMDSIKCGDYVVYGINPASHAYMVDAEKFGEIYEVLPGYIAY